MVLRIQCPKCGTAYRLQDPLPPEGKRYRCKCGAAITVAYPPEVKERLGAQGAGTSPTTTGSIPGPQTSTVPNPTPPPPAPPQRLERRKEARPEPHTDEETATTHRMPPSPEMQAFSGFTAPPNFAPLGGDDHGPGPDLTAPPSLPSLDETLRSHRKDPEPPPAPTPAPRAPAPPPAPARPTTEPGARRPSQPPRSVPAPQPPEAASTRPSKRQRPTPPPTPAEAAATRPSKRQRSQPAAPTPMQAAPPPKKPEKPAKKKDRGSGKPKSRLRRVLVWGVALLAFGVLAGAIGLAGILWHYSKGLPSVDSLAVYEPPVGTIVNDEQGNYVGEFFKQQRYVVPYEEIPENLRNAFVSAEDAAFWEHSGLDFMGIARAMITNLKERRMAQGASTITQQVARSFLLTREKKLARKIREAILSYRVENSFDKEHILYLYLNQIFLGHGAYGVGAAAHLYFDKDVSELNLAESAIIAGLPQAPSSYSPNRNFKKAKARQRYVLDQMAKRGYVTQEEADAAYEMDLVFNKKHDRNLDLAPFYVEHVRRYLFDRAQEAAELEETDPAAWEAHPYKGLHPLYSGLTVTIPIDLELQAVANQAVAEGVRFADKRIGWRGAKRNLTSAADIAKEKRAIDVTRTLTLRPYHPSFEIPDEGPVPADALPDLQEGELTSGVIKEVDRSWLLVDVGSHEAVLPLSGFKWCHNVNPEVNFKYFTCRRMDDVLKVGDVIDVRVDAVDETWTKTLPKSHRLHSAKLASLSMEQEPWPEASLLSMRTSDGGVLAMVGGSSYEGSEFNRAIQARRQVGSTFKPLVYAAALDNEDPPFNASSILLDAPIVEAMSGVDGKLWKPANSGGDYLGDTTFRRGLILSRNIVTLKICQAIGVEYALEYVKRFGFDSPIDPNLASCLGASAITLAEMVEAYSTFPTLGTKVEPRFITEVRDRHGDLVERLEPKKEPEVLTPETAYIMVNLMQGVVQSGTARGGLEVGVPVAGKTGTTNAYRDAWFMGYTPELITGVWVGLDEFKSMGRGQYGGEVALPIWVDLMKAAVKKYPPSEYERPEKIKMVSVDSMTGKLSRDGQPGVRVPFVKGTEPTEEAPAQGAMDAADFLSGEY